MSNLNKVADALNIKQLVLPTIIELDETQKVFIWYYHLFI